MYHFANTTTTSLQVVTWCKTASAKLQGVQSSCPVTFICFYDDATQKLALSSTMSIRRNFCIDYSVLQSYLISDMD